MAQQDTPQYYFDFSFFKVDPKWRWMADLAKEESAREVQNVLDNAGTKYRIYSTLGLRDDADFLFWSASESLDDIQKIASKLYSTVFGKYIAPSRTYLSMTRPSIYTKNSKVSAFLTDDEPKKYLIVYPFTKSKEWYLLPAEQRQKLMAEHIEVGKKYPEVVLNTTYSFGIHDQDFMLAFETEDLRRFQDLIMDLRQTAVSAYVVVDTPMIVCKKTDIIQLVASLG